jgi:hypothetical protein
MKERQQKTSAFLLAVDFGDRVVSSALTVAKRFAAVLFDTPFSRRVGED